MMQSFESKPGDAALGVDIGGSFLKLAPVDLHRGRLLADPIKIPTPDSAEPSDILPIIRDAVTVFGWTGPIGVGYPGVVKQGVISTAAHVSEAWLNHDTRESFGALTGERVNVINDADAAGLAEMRFGAGRDFNHSDGGTVLLFTFGTGIGSAVFIGGRLLPNTEFGHMYLDGVEAEDLAAASIRVREGLSWEQWADRVNRYMAEMEKLFNPDLIIFGGGITDNFDKYGHLLHTRAEIRRAEMQNDAGIVGAALAVTLP